MFLAALLAAALPIGGIGVEVTNLDPQMGISDRQLVRLFESELKRGSGALLLPEQPRLEVDLGPSFDQNLPRLIVSVHSASEADCTLSWVAVDWIPSKPRQSVRAVLARVRGELSIDPPSKRASALDRALGELRLVERLDAARCARSAEARYQQASEAYAREPGSNGTDGAFLAAAGLFSFHRYLDAGSSWARVRDNPHSTLRKEAALWAVIAFDLETQRIKDHPEQRIKDHPELDDLLVRASDRFLEMAPTELPAPVVAYRAAHLRFRDGRYAEARQRCESIIVLWPEMSARCVALGVLSYWKTGEREQAYRWAETQLN